MDNLTPCDYIRIPCYVILNTTNSSSILISA